MLPDLSFIYNLKRRDGADPKLEDQENDNVVTKQN